MPLGAVLLLGAELIRCLPFVQLAMLDRADGGDFIVVATQFSGVIEDRVDVKPGGLRAPCQLSEAQDQFLLEVIGESVLSAEEDHATLRDYRFVVNDLENSLMDKCDLLVIARSLRSSSEFSASSQSTRLAFGNSRPMTGVTSKESNGFRAPDNLSGCLCSDLDRMGVSTSIADGAMSNPVSSSSRGTV